VLLWSVPRLLGHLGVANRDFDAVVVGEYERAFYGDQFREVVARLNAVGVQVWSPEADGPVDVDGPVHQALLMLLGAQARREVGGYTCWNRIRALHRGGGGCLPSGRVGGRWRRWRGS
jgi:hypothetical protein